MNDNIEDIEQFWKAVIQLNYEAVRDALAGGFDVNARIPGKVAPITWAQPAKDMTMLRMLWEAGAIPATPWLEKVFSEFAHGSEHTTPAASMVDDIGRLKLYRYCGTEKFALTNAVLRRLSGTSTIELEATCSVPPIESLPDTAVLNAQPAIWISLSIDPYGIDEL